MVSYNPPPQHHPIFNGVVVAYLIIAIAVVVVTHRFQTTQNELQSNATQAKQLAVESARQAAIVAQNQKTGTDFFLKECVANRTLLSMQAEEKATASRADIRTADQFAKYGQTAMAAIVRTRAQREMKSSQQYHDLMPVRCGFTFHDASTGETRKVGN